MDLTKFYYSASIPTGNTDSDGVVIAKDANGIETEIARFVGLNVDAVAAPQNGNIIAAISYGTNQQTSLLVSIDEATGAWDVIASDIGSYITALEFKEDGTLVAMKTVISPIVGGQPDITQYIVEVDPTTGADINILQVSSAPLLDITTVGNDVWALSQQSSINDIPVVYNVADPTVRTEIAVSPDAQDPNGVFTSDDGKIILTFGGDDPALEFDPATNLVQTTTDYDPVLITSTDATSRETGPTVGTPPIPPSTDPVFGTEFADALTGDAGDNVIIALGGDDAIIGLAGNDALLGGDGNDSIDAGDGNDQLFGEFGDDTLFGGAGDDALFGGLGNDYLVGDADGTTGIDGIFGGEGNDTAFGGFGADYIDGGAGGDSLYGETGADQILGGEGNDFIDGGTENDIINGGAGNDILLGGLGDDEIRGEDGDDSILGQEGNDTIFGGFGIDTIDGGEGVDTIFGETGADTIYGGLGNDNISGGSGNDSLFGGEGTDVISGGTENDTIFAGFGNDNVFGNEGNDVLFGEDGDDALYVGAGIDVINGGAGNDVAVIGGADGQNFWQDFQDGSDRIVFSEGVTQDNFASLVSIAATDDGNSTIVTYDQTQLFLENVNASLINEQDFILVSAANLDDLA